MAYKRRETDPSIDRLAPANYLGIIPKQVYGKIHKEDIPYEKVGKHIRFKKSSIDAWLKKEGRYCPKR